MKPLASVVSKVWKYEESASTITLDRTTYPLYVGNASITNFSKWDGYGSYFTLTANVNSNEYTSDDIKWTINSDIAYFKDVTNDSTSKGKSVSIRARRTGIATATATLPDGAKASCVIPVIDNASRMTVEKLSFNADALTLKAGESTELKTVIYPKDIYNLGMA